MRDYDMLINATDCTVPLKAVASNTLLASTAQCSASSLTFVVLYSTCYCSVMEHACLSMCSGSTHMPSDVPTWSHAESQAPPTKARPMAAQKPVAKKAATVQHPMAELGGYKMPSVGNIGGAKGIGIAGGGVKKRTQRVDTGIANKASKAVSKEEADAIAAREAAKKRVQQRTLSTFGLG